MVSRPHSRAERDREVVQRTAELLTSNLSLEELFRSVCELLARFVDASTVFIALKGADGARVEYVFDNGLLGRLPNPRVDPTSRTAEVLRTGEPILKRRLEDWTEGRLTASLPGDTQHNQPQSAIFVPLKYGTEIIGALSVQTAAPDAYNEDDVSLLQTCALYLSVSVQRSQLESQSAALKSIASTDSLTGLANRRSFNERIRQEWERAMRTGKGVPVLLADIDFFKTFNDTYGHVAGDAALQQVANAILSCAARPIDFLARYGGEEFIAILPETDAKGALYVAESMRRAVADLGIAHSGSNLRVVTISVGIGFVQPGPGVTYETLIRAADAALYEAKRTGRNRVAADNYFSDAPAVHARKVHRHNLSSARRPMFGRTNDVRQVRALLRHAPLLTITGVAGCGKSALAIEAGRQELAHFRDGVWHVDLSSAIEPALLRTKIASIVHLPDANAQALRERSMLLILDNCDGVGASVAEFARMLQESANLRIVVTACEPLRIPGEVTLQLPALQPAAANELFDDRAQSVAGTRSIARSGLTEQICEHLGMLPLPLEFGAADLRDRSLPEIAANLPDRPPVTAKELGRWCWSLLSGDERRMIQVLSVFADGAAPAALSRVYDGKAEQDVPTLLGALVAKGLAIPDAGAHSTRYVLQNSILQYARNERELQPARLRFSLLHVRYFSGLAARLVKTYPTKDWQTELESVRPELENFRAALTHAVDELHDPQTGALLAIDLVRYWEELGLAGEGRSWLERLLALPQGDFPQQIQAGLLYGMARLDRYQSHSDRALNFAVKAVDIYRTLNDTHGLAAALLELGAAEGARRELQRAKACFAEALELGQAGGDSRRVAEALNGIAAITFWEGDAAGAHALFVDSLRRFRELQNDRGVASALANLGRTLAAAGDLDGAISVTRQSLAIFDRLHDPSQSAFELSMLGELELERGNLDGAGNALRGALERFAQYGDDWLAANSMDCLARLAKADGNWSEALRLLGFADALFASTGTPRQPHDQTTYDALLDAARLELGDSQTARILEEARACGRERIFTEALGRRT